MLLRRITKHVREQNWFAVFVDFIIVVVGVFIGIQVANWNEERQVRQAEMSALQRLIFEYQTNQTLIGENISESEKVVKATEEFLNLMSKPEQEVTDEIFAQTLLDCLTNPRFVPNLGVTNSLLSSGNLNYIDDAAIQTSLSQWQGDLTEIQEWQEIERMHGEELIYGVVIDYIPMQNLSLYFDKNTGSEKSNSVSDYRGLFSSKRLEGLLVNRRFNTLSRIKELDELDKSTESLIKLMNDRIKAIK